MTPLATPGGMPSLQEVRVEQMRRSFKRFVQAAWEHADPASLQWGWHLDALCTSLQAVADRQIDFLLINIPPGHAKSMIVSVLWPTWRWTREPQWSVMSSSYELGLVMRDAVKARSLVESDWYRENFRTHLRGPHKGEETWGFVDDQNTKKLYKNDRGGMRQGTSVGLGTGYRGDCLIVDDPLSVDMAYSDVEIEGATRWFFETMATRFNDMRKAQKIVIMQRLHERDVSGEILSREKSKWQHLCLPARFDPDRRAVVRDKDGNVLFSDPRTQAGQPLFPEKFDHQVLTSLESSLGPYGASGQLQQQPSPMGGGMLKVEWFAKRWALEGEFVPEGKDAVCGVPLTQVKLPKPINHIFAVTDATFKGNDNSDRVAIGVWAFFYPSLYLLDLVWDTLDFTGTLTALRTLKAKWNLREILIEDAANGAAIINTLTQEFPAVLPIKAEGSKQARILASAPYLAAGNVIYPVVPRFTPSPKGNVATLNALVGEAAAFPKGKYDDAIDMQAYAVNKFLGNSDLSALSALGQVPVGSPSGAPVTSSTADDRSAGLTSLRGI